MVWNGFFRSNKKQIFLQKFSDVEVKKEKLDKILEAGRVAPTAKNLQEQHIYVVQSEKGLEAIDKATPSVIRHLLFWW